VATGAAFRRKGPGLAVGFGGRRDRGFLYEERERDRKRRVIYVLRKKKETLFGDDAGDMERERGNCL